MATMKLKCPFCQGRLEQLAFGQAPTRLALVCPREAHIVHPTTLFLPVVADSEHLRYTCINSDHNHRTPAESHVCRNLTDRIKALEEALQTILDFSDLEMGDGDGARALAKRILGDTIK